MQLYKRLCPSIGLSVRRFVESGHQVEKWGNECFRYFWCMFECWEWVGVWMGHTMPTWGAGALAGLINQEELSKIYLRNHGAHINADANADAKVTKNRPLLTFLNMILYC